MEDQKTYTEAQKVARQICDIMQQHDLVDLTALKEWLEKNEEAGSLIEELTDDLELTQKLATYQMPDLEEAKKLLRQQIRHQQHRRQVVRFSQVAAILVLVITTAIFLRYSVFSTSESPLQPETIPFSAPTLITANGENINLSVLPVDSVIRISEHQFFSKNQNELKYLANEEEKQFRSGGMNQLVIPKQCNYRIILEDSSIVHLNAESRLEYPSQFPADKRQVRLIGEGYFEIRHDGRPFIVEADQVQIRVYGTKFNVKAYESSCIETVLAEGSIGISIAKHPAEERLLKPHQLSSINSETGEHIIRDVEIEKFISWTTGYLQYDNDPLERLIKDLGRWYGAEFDFVSTDLADIRISASINKDTPLSEVLDMIQTTAKIKFQQQERRYIVSR